VTERTRGSGGRQWSGVHSLSSSMEATIHDSVSSGQPRRRGDEANLIVIAHPDHRSLGRRYRLVAGASLHIGRSADAEISLPDVPSVSRRHARVLFENDVLLEDLGSRNGTYLNEIQVTGVRPLSSGDRFQTGTVVFKFLHEEDTENAYHEAIYELVIRDGLTNLYNRRKFHQELEREVARARRYGRSLSLVLFDIDHFKRVNDTFGHMGGDVVLRNVAHAADSVVRQEQVLARVGGEEFAVISPETTLEGACQFAEKLRVACEELTFTGSGVSATVTCSFGVAALDGETKTAEALYAAADRALYLAKAGGRNRVASD
jgi:two-component system cell cycle response regulator